MLALSATPDRQDGKHIVYYSYFDKIIDVEIEEQIDINFRFIGYNSKFEVTAESDHMKSN
jgi:superfamily II DNA or RNA helicase